MTAQQHELDLNAWTRDGFAIIEGFLPTTTCDMVQAHMAKLVREHAPEAHSVFSTRTRQHAKDDHFITSSDAIRFFFEEDQLLDAAGGLQNLSTFDALNKAGHALHDLDPVFWRLSRLPALAKLAAQIGFVSPRLIQSMYIFKNPRVGGEVNWHQDNSFIYTAPLSTVGFWFALEDATVANGCLMALPGMHVEPPRTRFVRSEQGLRLDVLDPTPWPTQEAVALEVPKGSLVILHGSLPHASAPNLSPHPRPAYTLHIVDGAAQYSDQNWLQRQRPFYGFDDCGCP